MSFNCPSLLTRLSMFSFKSGYVVRMGGEVFRRKLVDSAAVAIVAL